MKKPIKPKKAPEKKKPTPRRKTSSVRSKADKIKLATKIFKAYETGEFTLESCSGENGITARTLKNWSESISEIAKAYKKAKDTNGKIKKEGLRKKAADGLEKLVAGYYVEEEETTIIKGVNGKQVVQTITRKKKKYIAPNATAIIFALKALDPNTWNADGFEEDTGKKQVFIIGGKTIEF